MILLTGIEYMREEAGEKEKTQTAWQEGQKRGKTVNWSNGLKTFGKINCNNTLICTYHHGLLQSSLSEKKVFPGVVLLVGFIYTSIAAAFYFD